MVSKCHTWVWRPATCLLDSDDQLRHEDVLNDDRVVADRADHDNLLYCGNGWFWQKEHILQNVCTKKYNGCF